MLHNLIMFQVEALVGYRVVDIACGSGDAQTLCITDDDNVWSWGDGDYGKLGRGGSEGCKVSADRANLAMCCTFCYFCFQPSLAFFDAGVPHH